jgi:hypothetical protein
VGVGELHLGIKKIIKKRREEKREVTLTSTMKVHGVSIRDAF